MLDTSSTGRARTPSSRQARCCASEQVEGRRQHSPPGHAPEAIGVAARANRRVWSQPLNNMLGAWSGSPDRTVAAYLALSRMVPASAIIFDPRFTPLRYAHLLRDLLFCVLHQAIATAECTFYA